MWVKICANTNVDDAKLAAELGADAVGFVFAPSKRQVTVEQVAAITSHLPESIFKVGVFTTTDAEEILATAGRAGLTAAQLHSAFDPELVEAIVAGSDGKVRVLQVLDIPAEMELEDLRTELKRVLAHPYVMAVLLDASHEGLSGGTGRTFDWERVAETVRSVQRETDGQVVLAGGLHAENVGEGIARFAPWGVDVASGVEASYGKKSPQRLKAFLEAAKSLL